MDEWVRWQTGMVIPKFNVDVEVVGMGDERCIYRNVRPELVSWERVTAYRTAEKGFRISHDTVNYPSHYLSHPSGVECIEITEHMNFNVGNAIKYLWRNGLKSPLTVEHPEMGAYEVSQRALEKQIEDLKKAVWYINREIARLEPK